MTQPAVSNALKRLRHLLNDELFIKVPSGVRATPKAMQVWHERNHLEAGQQWLRSQLVEICDQLR